MAASPGDKQAQWARTQGAGSSVHLYGRACPVGEDRPESPPPGHQVLSEGPKAPGATNAMGGTLGHLLLQALQ